MKYNRRYNSKNILRTISFLSLISLLSVFSGCSDKSDDSQKQQPSSSSTPKIEIVKNTNAKEIKVIEKKKTKLQVKDGKAYYYDYNVKSGYDENSQPANSDAGVRARPRSVLDANMNIRSPYERVQISLIVRQLSKTFKLKCSPCHDDYANGVIGPSLLGKDAKFIYGKINDFKTGKKSNPLMNDLINMMSDEEIKSISQEIYKFNKEIEKLGARK